MELDVENRNLPKKRKPKKSLRKSRKGKKKKYLEGSDDSNHELSDELGYGSDFFKDEEDKARILNMNELERENIFQQRFEKREMRKRYLELKREHEKQGMESGKAGRIGAEFGSSEESLESSSEDKSESDEGSPSEYSADGENGANILSESQDKNSNQNVGLVNKLNPATFLNNNVTISKSDEIKLNDLERIRVSRDMLEKWIGEVFFTKTIIGCFVKVNIGTNRTSNSTTYLICEILDIKDENKGSYALGKKKTSKYLLLRNGPTEKCVKMNFVSNSKFTEEEFSQWEGRLSKLNMRVKKETIVAKEVDIQEALKYNYSNKEIDEMVSNKLTKKLERGLYHNINITYELNKLRSQIQKARIEFQNNPNGSTKYLIDKLEEKILRLEELDAEKSHELENAIQSKTRVDLFNEKNKLRQKQLDNERSKIKKTKAEDETIDPFRRRTCKPTIMWHTNFKHQQNEGKKEKKSFVETKSAAKSEQSKKSEKHDIKKLELRIEREKNQHLLELEIDSLIDSDPDDMSYFKPITIPKMTITPLQINYRDGINYISLSKWLQNKS